MCYNLNTSWKILCNTKVGDAILTVKKMGRPTDDPKNYQVVVKLNEDSRQILLDFCQENGVTRSEAIRIAILRLMDGPKKEGE